MKDHLFCKTIFCLRWSLTYLVHFPPFSYVRVSEKEEKCDCLTATLQSYKEQLGALQVEKARAEKELKSSLSNLASALKKSKDSCADQTSQLQELERKKRELVTELEDLRHERNVTLSNRTRRVSISTPGSPLRCGGKQLPSNSGGCSTPSKAIPEESQIVSLQVENKRLKQELSCLQTNFQLTSQKSTQLRSDMKEAEASLEELQAHYENVVQEKLDILSKFEVVKSEVERKKQPRAEREKELNKLKERVEELQMELDCSREENLEFQKKVKAEGCKAKDGKILIGKLESQLKSLKEDKVSLDNEVAGVRRELCDLQEKLYESNATRDGLKTKTSLAVEALECKASRLTREKKGLFEELSQCSKQLDQAQDDIQTLEGERQRLESRLQDKEREIESLRAHLNQASSQPQDIETLQVEICSLKKEIDELQFMNDDKLESSKASLEHKVSELTAANIKLKRDLGRETKKTEEVARKIIAELEVSENKVQTLEINLQDKVKECSNLRGKFEMMESRFAASMNTKGSLEEHLGDLKTKARELEEKNDRLELQLKEAKRERVRELDSTEASNQKILELESKLDAAEFAVLERESTISDFKCASEMMEMENSSLLAQVTSLSEMVAARNLKLEAQQSQMNQHQMEVYEIVEKIAQLEREHGACGKTSSQLTRKNEELEASLEEETARKDALKEQVCSLKEEITKLKLSQSDVKLTKADMQGRLEELMSKHDDLSVQYSILLDQNCRLERDLKSETSSMRASRVELGQEQRRYNIERQELEDKVESLLSKRRDSEEECNRLQQEKAILNLTLSDMKTEVEDLKFSYSNLVKERDGLGEQYEKLKESALSVLLSESFTVSNDLLENKSPTVEDALACYEKSATAPGVEDMENVLLPATKRNANRRVQAEDTENRPPQVTVAADKLETPKEQHKKLGTRQALQKISIN